MRNLKAKLYDSRPNWTDPGHRYAAFIRGRLRPQMAILDLGAGPGKNGPVNYRGEVAAVVGVDPDGRIKDNPFVDLRVQASADALPFRPARFDLVFSDWVIEHLAAPSEAAREVYRVLKPGGTFIFRTGNLFHYSYAVAKATPHWFHLLVANWARGLSARDADPYPTCYRMNTRGSVRRTMRQAGFVEEALLMWEPHPAYLMFSVPSFLLGVAYERSVNRFQWLRGMRAFLVGSFRKPESTPAHARLQGAGANRLQTMGGGGAYA